MVQQPEQASVVIIGAGIVGASAAYHLAQKGLREIVVLEKDRWPGPGGSTSHASDFIYPIDHTKAMTKLSMYGIELYSQFGRYLACGGLEVARTDERLAELKRKIASGKSWGVEAELISPQETKRLFPFVDETRIKGAMYVPSAGLVTRSVDAAKEMVDSGEETDAVRLLPETPVTGIDVHDGRVRGVHIPNGYIRTDTVICAAGVWGPLIGEMAGASIPLSPVHHPLMFTGSVPELRGASKRIEYPLFRDQDVSAYVRQEWDTFEFGYYERYNPRLVEPGRILSPEEVRLGLSPTMEPLAIDHVIDAMTEISEVVPCLGTVEWNMDGSYNGLLSFTPDGAPIVGESPEVRGFWLGEAVWVKDGPGVGKLLAEWILDGAPQIDPHPLNVARFYPHAKTRSHVRARSAESARKVYGIVHPREQYASSRGVRLSPFNSREKDLGANFFETGGWERPQWYESNRPLLDVYRDRTADRPHEWDARWWSPIITAEHLAMRDRVGMIDLTAFAKFDVSGPGALDYMQRMVVAQMDVAVGRAVYTPLLDEWGGVKADLTITRLDTDYFRIVTGGGVGHMDKKWFMEHLPGDGSVHFEDVTSSLCVLGVWGPQARDVMGSVTEDDVSNQAFPFATAREITLGPVSVWALRISYVGELGWELYAPVEQGPRLWDLLWEAGQPYGITPVGIGVYGTTARLEKGYRLQGSELETEYDPYEAGIARPKVKRQAFIGRDPYLAAREQAPAAKLCTLSLDDPRAADGTRRYMTGSEPILNAGSKALVDDRGRRSYVTSAGDAPSVGKYLLMGYVPPAYALEGQKLCVEYFGERYPVTVEVVGNRPLFDPDNSRMKS